MTPQNPATTIRWSPADRARLRWLKRRLEMGDNAAVSRFCIKSVYDVLASGQSFPIFALEAPVITEEDDDDA